VIKVTTIKYYGPGFPIDEVTADERIAGLMRLYWNDDLQLVDDHGLSRMDTRYGTAAPQHWFAGRNTESLLLRCASPKNNVCQGYLQLKDWQLQVQFLFSRGAVPEHEVIVSGVRKLLEHWRLEEGKVETRQLRWPRARRLSSSLQGDGR
jgi:hypothetical protein